MVHFAGTESVGAKSVGTEPLYRSHRHARSIWCEYRLYADRIELETWQLGTRTVPFSRVSDFAARPSGAISEWFRGEYWRAAKLDLADFYGHVVLEKTGFYEQLRFTPDDPESFVRAAREALDAFRKNKQEGA